MVSIEAYRIAVGVLAVVFFVGLTRRFYMSQKYSVDRTSYVVSRVDGQYYRVHTKLHDESDAAADILATVNNRLIATMRHLKSKYRRKKGARGQAVRNLLRRYNPDRIVENTSRDPSGDTSYTLNKGNLLAFCLRSRETHQLHNVDLITFVALHELAHVACDAPNHRYPFWETFKFILLAAEEGGIFVSTDYSQAPIKYCGLDVAYNPRWDPLLASI